MTDMKKLNEQEVAIVAGGDDSNPPQYTSGGIPESGKKDLENLKKNTHDSDRMGDFIVGEHSFFESSLAKGVKGPKIG